MTGPHRAPSGDATTVSYNQLLVLHALSARCHYGLEVMNLTGLSSGTVYPILRRFEASGLVTSSREGDAEAHAHGRPARRLHTLSPHGVTVLTEARESLLERQRAIGLMPTEG